MVRTETLDGFVIDVACVRKYPRADLLEKARNHSRQCSLMGHCLESGYALVSDEGAAILDSEATPQVLDAVRASSRIEGIRLRAVREEKDGEMRTVRLEEVR